MKWWGSRLEAIDHKLDVVIARLSQNQAKTEKINMATQAELDALTAQVTANTSITASAALALNGFVKTVADLTAQLQAAVSSNDSTAINAVTAALAANNVALSGAVPAVAAAVSANA